MSESLICTLLQSSNFIEGNRCNISLNETLIATYDKLFNLKIKYSQSLNSKGENLSPKELPYIIYGATKIERGNLHSFLKRLTNIDYNLSLTDDYYLDGIQYSKMEFFILEKMILTDLQTYLDNYLYLKSLEDSGMFMRIIKLIYQPIQTIKTFIFDSRYLIFNSKQYGITDVNNIIFYVKKIADKIEEYIKSKGVSYYEDLDRRFINSTDVLIYSAHKLIKKIFETYIYKTSESSYKYTEIFIANFNKILSNEKNMKNQLMKLLDSQSFKYEKPPVVNRKFAKYLDICKLTDAEQRQKNRQKLLFTSGFFASFMLLYLFKKQ